MILARQFEVFSSLPKMRNLLLAVTLFSLVNSSDVFLIMHAHEQDYSDSAVIGAYALYNLLYTDFAFPLGGLADKFGKRFTLRFGFSAYVLSYLLFARVPVSSILVLGFGIYVLYAASTENVIKAWISELTPKYLRALAFGLLTMLMGLGMLFSSTIAGWL
ncbi:MAG: MFS transporter [SAR324 cluster bacterium]|uniref:MFS transporter n=1 Tax=SAR324 cluster bacterium TaxID=2024889 RepID=A0A7X9IJ72_9DELT|nr:MFS transporter [SAR324 cluster bacterium]